MLLPRIVAFHDGYTLPKADFKFNFTTEPWKTSEKDPSLVIYGQQKHRGASPKFQSPF